MKQISLKNENLLIKFDIEYNILDDNIFTQIIGNTYIDDFENEELISKVKCLMIDLSKDVDVSFELDERDESLLEFIDFFESLEDKYSKAIILERIEVLPKYQKNNITKKTIEAIKKLFFSENILIVLKVFPLQHEVKNSETWLEMNYSNEVKEVEYPKDFENLKNFYISLGFEEYSNKIIFYISG